MVEGENDSMKEQLENMIGSVESLTQERDQLAEDKGKLTKEMEKKLEVAWYNNITLFYYL